MNITGSKKNNLLSFSFDDNSKKTLYVFFDIKSETFISPIGILSCGGVNTFVKIDILEISKVHILKSIKIWIEKYQRIFVVENIDDALSDNFYKWFNSHNKELNGDELKDEIEKLPNESEKEILNNALKTGDFIFLHHSEETIIE